MDIQTYCFHIIHPKCSSHQKLKNNFFQQPKLISTSGYPVEKHRVTTDDGYILQMHRIPAGRRTARKTGTRAKGKKAVLVMHGLLGSSGDFVIMGPDRSLGKFDRSLATFCKCTENRTEQYAEESNAGHDHVNSLRFFLKKILV